MMTLFIILLAVASPPQYCNDVRLVLDDAVASNTISKEEARRIYDRCVHPPE